MNDFHFFFLCVADISWIRKTYPTSFIAVYDPSASERASLRASCFDAGANMVAHDIESLLRTIEEAVIPAGSQGGSLVCPYCSLRNLSENEMWYHCPAYHINWPNEVPVTNNCPICRETLHEPLQVMLPSISLLVISFPYLSTVFYYCITVFLMLWSILYGPLFDIFLTSFIFFSVS
jgi:hypothetical protein